MLFRRTGVASEDLDYLNGDSFCEASYEHELPKVKKEAVSKWWADHKDVELSTIPPSKNCTIPSNACGIRRRVLESDVKRHVLF